tara:strand:- start:1391 stop:1846 length:456 start_codon:yes stop_codon:yes gene_type:complete
MVKDNKVLGKNTKIPNSPIGFKFDLIKNRNRKFIFNVRLTITEFTSICPVTTQPDFGILFIDYVPKSSLVESKSLKTYIHSYRNYGIFHEDVVIKIGTDIFNSIRPIWFRIAGYFAPRGGIPIDVFWQSGKKPINVVIPELSNFDRKIFNR